MLFKQVSIQQREKWKGQLPLPWRRALFAINRTQPLKDNVKSRVKMCGLPNRIVSSISLRIFQPLSAISYLKRKSFICFAVWLLPIKLPLATSSEIKWLSVHRCSLQIKVTLRYVSANQSKILWIKGYTINCRIPKDSIMVKRLASKNNWQRNKRPTNLGIITVI